MKAMETHPTDPAPDVTAPKRTGLTAKGLGAAYVAMAIFGANTLLCAVVLIVLAGSVDRWLDRRQAERDISQEAIPNTLKPMTLGDIYPNLSPEDLRDLMSETWSRPLSCDPWAQFGERAHTGRFVNVDPAGFRRSTRQGPWPPPAHATNIFLFGGSTLFGYGVRDDETIASRLSARLADAGHSGINVYNFGRGYYFSTQEMVLFIALLSDGHAPHLAIFIDGLNDFFSIRNAPRLTGLMESVFEGETESLRHALTILAKRIPLVHRFSKGRLGRLGFVPTDPIDDPERAVALVIGRYLRNIRLIDSIGGSRGINTLFVWQPVPKYRYDEARHPFGGVDIGQAGTAMAAGYALLDPARGSPRYTMPSNWHWLGGMQEGSTEALYIDRVHYTPSMNDHIAREIANAIQTKGLLGPPATD